jgi:hypothetical protein
MEAKRTEDTAAGVKRAAPDRGPIRLSEVTRGAIAPYAGERSGKQHLFESPAPSLARWQPAQGTRPQVSWMVHGMSNSTDLEAGTDCGGAARAPDQNGEWPIGANAMRSVLALSLLIALCASANAARVHHSKPRHVITRPSQPVDPRFPPVLEDQTPSYDDPSRRGGG